MVKDSMDLRKALQVLVEGIMGAEVSARIGAEHGERSSDRLTPCRPITRPVKKRQIVRQQLHQESRNVDSLTARCYYPPEPRKANPARCVRQTSVNRESGENPLRRRHCNRLAAR